MLDGKMHQTTLRMSPDLWQALEQECKRLGVSAAQYLREAALARLAYTAGRRGLPDYELALAEAGSPALPIFEVTEARLSDAAAVMAQSERAREQAREVRAHAEQLRRRRHARS
jgi:predicted DNA-binding protein